jgi:hypothetical protein
LQRLQAQGLEARGLSVCPGGACELAQWWTPPQPERFVNRRQPTRRVRPPAGRDHSLLKAAGVNGGRFDLEHVAARPSCQARRFVMQQFAELRHVGLHGSRCPVGTSVTPQFVDQAIGADRLAGMNH